MYRQDLLSNGLFMLDLDSLSSYVAYDNTIDSLNWYATLGHISKERMTRLAREGFLRSLTNFNLPMCESCIVDKSYKKPFGKSLRASCLLELLHSNICGPINIKAHHVASYFLTFIDDYLRFGYIYS